MRIDEVVSITVFLLFLFTPALGHNSSGTNFSPVISGESRIQDPATSRETVLDRRIHFEETIYEAVPEVSRLCDEAGYEGSKINTGDCGIYVEQAGSGVPIVLVHGGPGGSHHYFHPWFAEAETFARVIYYDQRGCGLSDFQPGPDGYSVDQAAQDLEKLRKSLNIDQWVVLGYSYGGLLSQYYVTQFPDSVLGLVLVNASPGMDREMQGSRQYEFISKAERERFQKIQKKLMVLMQERKWSEARLIELMIYNLHLNGLWKRQEYYRPSKEQVARLARYEWVHDKQFNSIMGRSVDMIDLTGAFEGCPIPVWITEGRHDLTWGTDKPGLIKSNHPGASIKFYEASAHDIYSDQPQEFFADLEGFVTSMPAIDPVDMEKYKLYLNEWRKEQGPSVRTRIRTAGWGRKASLELAADYLPEWLDEFRKGIEFMRTGFALYDAERYEDAASVFRRMSGFGAEAEFPHIASFGLVWEGHMLDLLSMREEAVSCYRKALDLDVTKSYTHSQYGMKYSLALHAKLMLEKPFARIENQN